MALVLAGLMIPPAVVMTGFALFLVYALRRDGHPLAEIQNAVRSGQAAAVLYNPQTESPVTRSFRYCP